MQTARCLKAVLVIVACVTSLPAFAEKPGSPGNSGKQNSARSQAVNSESYFTDSRIITINDYYASHKRPGGCPPGLAKKNNGCLPPGQARKWRRGEPLPAGVIYYDLPGALLEKLGGPPAGKRVVRVDEDLLLISIATGMVIEALEL